MRQERRRRIGAAVIDHDKLHVARIILGEHLPDRLCDRALFVVRAHQYG